jgi:hypothetical protein
MMLEKKNPNYEEVGGYDHTNMTAPIPVCSAKISMFGPG